ncbi:Two-component response regulator, SAPR family, consists of REC, wHTH and BTAD domains [Sporobacter termitidis DSM 10068]|uniref:Stage 0 sporulation protein A homolog n=1 Tax=Sporobacter termitidis DSM 10068 TaxID=1123282 RepID=A0A1M5Z4I8_9FIRM|nr:response regulator [Sporobacter termitidis]SHI19028.1 Two-component response regulator, SAPR family, consists of REC, wHTH and BTAD domains [Sporobacter termitidis DSM 10068]
MLNAIIIDDERPALKELEYMLVDYQDIVISGMYTDPMIALKDIQESRPEIVFLDIKLPQINGIDLAIKITASSPDTDIIFITAYDSYAVRAFDVCALDYLLKPISKDRLEKTIQRIKKKHTQPVKETKRRLVIKCFGEFRVGWEDQEPIKWRTEKTKELFALLLHNYGRTVSKPQIIDAIWPDINPENAEHQLHNGIYYIRKKLSECEIPRENILLSGNYCLKLSDVSFDCALFNEYLPTNINALPLDILQKLEAEYAGDYFENNDWPWAENDRYAYSRQYYQIAYKLSEIYFETHKYEKAERLLQKLIRNNPYDEQPLLLLIKIFISLNRKSEAKRLIDDFRKTLENDLGVQPSNELKAIYGLLDR